MEDSCVEKNRLGRRRYWLPLLLLAAASATPSLAADAEPAATIATETVSAPAVPVSDAGIALPEAPIAAEAEVTPEEIEALYLLGRSLNRQQERKAAIPLQQALMLAPEHPGVNFELGLYYHQQKIYSEAQDFFDTTLSLQAEGEMANDARHYLARAQGWQQEKNWEVTLLTGLQYDSNVILIGDNTPAPAAYSGKSDWRSVFSARGTLVPLRREKGSVALSYSFYQSLHATLDAFDVSQSLLELSGSYDLTPRLKMLGNYALEHLFLSGHLYDYAHQLSPALLLSLGQDATLGVFYRYRNSSYRDSDDFPDNSDRRGGSHILGISSEMPITNIFSLWGEYAHESSQAKRRHWEYDADRAIVGVRLHLPRDLMADLSGELNQTRYAGQDPDFGGNRKDTQSTLAVTATRALSARWSLSAGHTYVWNRSSLSPFDYERATTSFFLNARF